MVKIKHAVLVLCLAVAWALTVGCSTRLPMGCPPKCAGANLHQAKLYGVHLRGADLTNAHMSDAKLRGADLSGADLRGGFGCLGGLSGVRGADR